MDKAYTLIDLDVLVRLCKDYDVIFEINSMNIIIRKYFFINNKPYNFNKAFSFEIFQYIDDLEECFIEFDRSLKEKLKNKGE